MSNQGSPANVALNQTKRSRLGSLMGVKIVGIGSSVPENPIKNEDMASLGYDAD